MNATRTATTLHDDCEALNAAFAELDLEWQWDPQLYASLASVDGERARVCAYLTRHQPHLSKVYDIASLCDQVLAARHRHSAPAEAAA